MLIYDLNFIHHSQQLSPDGIQLIFITRFEKKKKLLSTKKSYADHAYHFIYYLVPFSYCDNYDAF